NACPVFASRREWSRSFNRGSRTIYWRLRLGGAQSAVQTAWSRQVKRQPRVVAVTDIQQTRSGTSSCRERLLGARFARVKGAEYTGSSWVLRSGWQCERFAP